jgi:cysteinyl-tRNA synthetase
VLDDLDLPKALSAVWGLVGDRTLPPAHKAVLVRDWDSILGLDVAAEAEAKAGTGAGEGRESAPPPGAEALLTDRARARSNRDWAESDRLREELALLGVEVTDTREGTRWRLR